MTTYEYIMVIFGFLSVVGVGLGAHMSQRSKIDKLEVENSNLKARVDKVENIQETHNEKIQENFTTIMDVMNKGFNDIKELIYSKNK
jgi:outer membrane murein-binding lipoprotein Lpp